MRGVGSAGTTSAQRNPKGSSATRGAQAASTSPDNGPSHETRIRWPCAAKRTLKSVTFSAEKELIDAARARARAERTTLNEAFRRWLAEYACREPRADRAKATIEHIQRDARTGGRRFTRDEITER